MASPSPSPPVPIDRARAKTRKVREDLHVAGSELELSNAILDRKLDPRQKDGDVGKALAQNEDVAQKVIEAKDELHEVEHLLQQEHAERQRLERELSRRAAGG